MKFIIKNYYSRVLNVYYAFNTRLMSNKIYCKNCKKELIGRSDKRFCDNYCKSQFHYEIQKSNESSFYRKVDNQLKLNRKILKNYNRAGKSIIRAEVLVNEGFNYNYFTHYWKNQKGDVYFFNYEYGVLRKKEKGIDKYVLVKHQDYMNR